MSYQLFANCFFYFFQCGAVSILSLLFNLPRFLEWKAVAIENSTSLYTRVPTELATKDSFKVSDKVK